MVILYKYNKILKKAAMFGLDARIALAIFGALSVISGAALYSAIKSANTEKWRQYFEELIKASEQYYLDNGKQMIVKNLPNLDLYVADLATNRENLSTWKGPYFQTTAYSGNWIRDGFSTSFCNGVVQIYLRTNSNWIEMNDFSTDGHCVKDNLDCYEWITMGSGTASCTSKLRKVFNDLDDIVDNNDGALAGKVRYSTYESGYIMYKGLQHTYR